MTSGLFWGRTHLGMALSCSLGAERWAGWECAPGFGFLGGVREGRQQTEQTLQHNVSHRAENRHPCLSSLLPPIPDPMIRIAPAATRSAVDACLGIVQRDRGAVDDDVLRDVGPGRS